MFHDVSYVDTTNQSVRKDGKRSNDHQQWLAKEALNGSQLYGLASSTATALGGSTVVNPNGSISAPSYDLSGSTYHDVGSALDAINAKAGTGSPDGVQYDTSAHDKVTFGGTKATAPVVLTNVANGVLNASSTDAVNGAQLFATNQNVSNLAGGGATYGGGMAYQW